MNRIETAFLEEMEKILEKEASIKGVVKGTMLAGATAASLGAAGTAPWWGLAAMPGARAQRSRLQARGEAERKAGAARRRSQAETQLQLTSGKRSTLIEEALKAGKKGDVDKAFANLDLSRKIGKKRSALIRELRGPIRSRTIEAHAAWRNLPKKYQKHLFGKKTRRGK
jgi:hypothetical protein